MKPPAATLVLTLMGLFALLSPTLACKCLHHNGGAHHAAITEQCCRKAHGKMVKGPDCDAHSMSNDLSAFAQCCAGKSKKSDCRCPVSC